MAFKDDIGNIGTRLKALLTNQTFLEIVGKSLGPAIISAVAVYIGIMINANLQATNLRVQQLAEETKKTNLMIDITSKQKQLDIDVGLRLLERVLQAFFEKAGSADTPEAIRTQLLLLKLVAINLWDVPVNLKPLYRHMERQLQRQAVQLQDQKQGVESLLQELRSIAKEVARKQAFRLSSGEGIDTGAMDFSVGSPHEVPNVVFANQSLKIALHRVEESSASVSLVFEGEFEKETFGPFEVTYFDEPLIDNTKRENLRVAIVLLNTAPEAKAVSLRVVAFDSELATDRIDIAELTRQLRQRSYPIDISNAASGGR